MSHTIDEKSALVSRARRIGGQVKAIEEALENERDCSHILQIIAACHGAINGLMGEILRGHLYSHVIDPKRKPTADQIKSANELMAVIKAYLR